MTRTDKSNRMIALVASTALASLALGGCATQAAPRGDLSVSKAQKALAKGRTENAITHAEAAVLAEPRNASYRAMLGAVYMEAGRFQSAATSFKDALDLGDASPKTALSYALAQIATGNNGAAIAMLEEWRGEIDGADYGLALALAGEADRGVHVLGNLLRAGHSNPKVRQNLAYSYALQGNWRAARIMAAEDVPADQLDARISEWARSGKPEDHQVRVASLLAVPVVGDSGQPVALALNNNPGTQQLAQEAVAAPAPVSQGEYAYAETPPELPPVAARPETELSPVVGQSKARPDFTAAFAQPAPVRAAPTPVASRGVSFVSSPVVQEAPARRAVENRRVARAVSASKPVAATPADLAAAGSHLVQLGSFSSEAGAKRAWGIYSKRYPQLREHDMVITKAIVRGKTYYRVSAAGFAKNTSRSMCSTVKRSGHGCIAWAANAPLPGAIDNGIRMAIR